MVGDASGRIFVSFEGDGIGVHEVVYRSKGSMFHGPLVLRRLVKPNGSVSSRKVMDGESVPSAVFSAIESAISEAHSVVSRMILPQRPEEETAGVRFLLAQNDDLLVTIDNASETRIYVRQRPNQDDDSPISSRKRNNLQIRDSEASFNPADTPMVSSSPPRKRRLENG